MSLINEALKKAQKQRTGESPSLSSLPSIGGEKPSQIARRGNPSGLNDLLIPVGLGVGVLAILIVGGVLLFRGKGDGSTPESPANVAAAVAATPAPAAPAPVPAAVVAAPASTTPPSPAASANTFVVPNVTPAAPTTTQAAAPVRTEPPKPEPAQPVVVQAAAPVVELPKPEPVRAEPAKPAVPGKLEPRAINYIEGIRVAGIRASGNDSRDSKVLMNDRVYRIGDMVEHEMGLKLVGITSGSLTFEDERGAKYTRSF